MIGPGNRSVRGKCCILLIDQDPSVGRRVALSVGGPQSEIFIASDPSKGIELAASKKPNLILMETQFKDANGIEMARKLLRSAGTQGIAIVFLTAEDSVAQRFRGIQAGAIDYILKDTEGKNLSPRLASILASLGKPRPRLTVGPRAQMLLEQIETIEHDAKSGTINLQRPGQSASITFSFGELQHAQCGTKIDAEALNEIAAHENWKASFLEEVKFEERSSHENSEITAPEHAPPLMKKRENDVLDLHATEPSLPAISEEIVEAVVSPLMDQLFLDDEGASFTSLEPEKHFPAEDHPLQRDEDTDRTLMGAQGLTIAPVHPFEGREDPTHTEVPSGKRGGLATIKRKDSAEGLMELSSLLESEPSNPQLTLESTFKEGEETPTNTFPTREEMVLSRPRGIGEGDILALDPPSVASEIASWLSSLSNPHLLLVMPKGNVRDELQTAVELLGFSVTCASTGLEAYTFALKKRPLVIISETRGVKVDGRELLTAIRSDFLTRETAFLMVSGEHIAQQIQTGVKQALAPVLQGLEAAIATKAHFHTRLNHPEFLVSGRVEPIGIAHLLREIWRAHLSGRLSLKKQGFCQAEVLIVKGNIGSVTIDEGQIVMGPLAFLNLLGYEWQEYSFTKDTTEKQKSVGDTNQLVEVACELNNILLYKLYQKGITSSDVNIDRNILDSYLQTLPFGTLKVLIRLVEGEKAVSLAEQGVAAPGVLKSFLHDFRRKGVLRLVAWDLLDTELARFNKLWVPMAYPQHRSGRHWGVAFMASVITIALAIGGYWGYQRLVKPHVNSTTEKKSMIDKPSPNEEASRGSEASTQPATIADIPSPPPTPDAAAAAE